MPIISISSATATEGNNLVFTLTLSEPASDAVTAEFQALSNGSANDVDMDASFGSTYDNHGTVTFAPGETTAYFTIGSDYDSAEERDESFTV